MVKILQTSYLGLALNEVNNNEAVNFKKVNLNKVAIQDIRTLLVISSSLRVLSFPFLTQLHSIAQSNPISICGKSNSAILT